MLEIRKKTIRIINAPHLHKQLNWDQAEVIDI